jgi:hypothetical protein
MPFTDTYKVLWNDAYLKSFAAELNQPACPHIFWEIDENGDLVDFKKGTIRKMMRNFFPALGVHNLVLGDDDKGVPTQTLVFIRDKRCEEIDNKIVRIITNKVFSYMGKLGDDISAQFHSGTNPFSDEFICIIPDRYDLNPVADTRNSAFRYFTNGWLEITADGVSNLKSYADLEENTIVWNSSVIPREYAAPVTKQLIEEQFQSISVDGIHPDTGEYLEPDTRKELHKEYQQKLDEFETTTTPTHFKDFVENLAREEDGEVDEKALARLELAIGYLCHRHHKDSNRRYVVLVDKFSDGLANASNGGSGKSLLVNTLGNLMNLTELDGRTFKKGKDDMAAFAPVTPATEICHIDDAAKGFPAEILFTRTTGNFHIRRLYKSPFSIDKRKAPKIVVTSNFPLGNNGHSYTRREFIVEVSNFYRLKSEFCQETPCHLHGYKDFGTDWDANDWSAFYQYVFACIGKYIAVGELPTGDEGSDAYKRARLVELVGSSELLDYLTQRLDEYAEHGKEVFAEHFYREVRAAFPEETEHLKNSTLYHYLVAVRKVIGKYPNKFNNGALEKQRLTDERWNLWQAAGMGDWVDKTGKHPAKGEGRVQTLKVSSMGNMKTNFSTPNFTKKKGEAAEEEAGGSLVDFFGDE